MGAPAVIAVALALGLVAAPCAAIAQPAGTASCRWVSWDPLDHTQHQMIEGERTVTTKAGLDRPGRAPCARREGAIHAHTQ